MVETQGRNIDIVKYHFCRLFQRLHVSLQSGNIRWQTHYACISYECAKKTKMKGRQRLFLTMNLLPCVWKVALERTIGIQCCDSSKYFLRQILIDMPFVQNSVYRFCIESYLT